jgi:flagellar biosynthesis protein FlhF
MKKDGPRIMALVGPTGVGKTTTIAKLAALAYKHGAPVALITIDTFRIGGVEQLRTYSSIMGVPLTVASNPAELVKALAVHSDKRLIFIDTAGQSPNDQKRLRELNSFLNVDPAIETHLCLSATTRDKELSQTIAKFGILPVSRVIFTKLDESESFGCMVNVHMRDKFPISYLTNGQRVPEDIEIASSGKIADLVVREITS